MSLFSSFNKKKSQGLTLDDLKSSDTPSSYQQRESEASKPDSKTGTSSGEKQEIKFRDLRGGADIYEDPGLRSFVEIWGSNAVNNKRMFVITFISVVGAIGATIFALKTASEKTATPILVEYNGNTGEYKKPVVIERTTATDAMVKYGLAKWAEYVFTVDPKLSLNYLRNADAMAAGRAKGQFAQYRINTDIMKEIRDGKKLVFAESKSVDILQKGVSIVNLETQELDINGRLLKQKVYRVRLDYKVNPPIDAAVILKNPIGLTIEGFTFDEVSK